MELNSDKIVKVLECCVSGYCFRDDCPLCESGGDDDIKKCTTELAKNALSLIKELAEENAKLARSCTELTQRCTELERKCASLNEENERLRAIPEQLHNEMSERMAEERKIERKLAVRKMQERLRVKGFHHINFGYLVYGDDIDQIAKEMVEEEK